MSASPWALQKRIFIKTEGSEASKAFIQRRKSAIPVDRHMGRLRERVPGSRPGSSINRLHGVHLPGFLWPIILIRLVHSLDLASLRTLHVWVLMPLLAKTDSTTKAYG